MAMPRPRTPIGMMTVVGIGLLLVAAVLAVLKQETPALIVVLVGAVVVTAVFVMDVRKNHAGATVGRPEDGWDGSSRFGGTPSSQTNVPMRPGKHD